jgi:serine/threonine-protein kinase
VKTPTTSVRPGIALGSSQYRAEAAHYFQQRLVIFYQVTVSIALMLYVAASVLILKFPAEWAGHAWLSRDRVIHAGALLLGAALLFLLRRRSFDGRALLAFDAIGLYISIGASLAIYVAAFEKGMVLMPALVAIFLILRAVIVPSTARTTVLLSLPAAIGMFAIQLAHGTVYVGQGVRMGPGMFVPYVVWVQCILGAAIAVAAVASHVNFGLRREIRKAQQLGQYRLERKIGEGGMGEVYLATHAMLRRPTAIKLLRPTITGEETIRRFEREVRETSRLTHPNTVSIYDYGRTPDGVFYYAMEYLDGKNLRAIVEETGPMAPARVIHILRQVCAALAEAHAKRLVHRDIKPGNIVLCTYGGGQDVVKLVDFGLVRDLGGNDPRLTQLGQICGTPETLAPELLGGEEATGRSDIYSLAVVGCYLLTGAQIFDAKSAAEFVGHHLHTDPIPPSARNPDVPKDLERVLLGCLSKDPGRRPTDVTTLSVQLEDCEHAGKWTQEIAAAWWAGYAAR